MRARTPNNDLLSYCSPAAGEQTERPDVRYQKMKEGPIIWTSAGGACVSIGLAILMCCSPSLWPWLMLLAWSPLLLPLIVYGIVLTVRTEMSVWSKGLLVVLELCGLIALGFFAFKTFRGLGMG